MNDQHNALNTYFWNVGNDIADIRLLAEGALALFEGDAEPLHCLGMKIAQGITEELKGRDQMAWVGAMNNIRACAEEIVYAELVYA